MCKVKKWIKRYMRYKDALLWKFDNACRGIITHLIMNFIKTFGDEEKR